MSILLLSTCLHYLAILPIGLNSKLLLHKIYINTIIYSTTIGCIYIYYPHNIILYIDYFLAILWFYQDILWSMLLKKHIIYNLNLIIFLLSIIKSELSYIYVWKCNVLSIIKCIYVSSLISDYNR
jgi:hypothetical protein